MSYKTTVQSRGADLGVCIPQDIADDLGIKEGTSIELSLNDNVLRIRKTKPNLNETITSIDSENLT